MWFYADYEGKTEKTVNGQKMINVPSIWLTNLDHKKRHEELVLYRRYTPDEYPSYDNFDAINIDKTTEIPADFDGVMGVPITFLDKFNPDQFEIIGITKTWFGLANKMYPNQIQVDKSGKRSVVSKLNDGAVLQVSSIPVGQTYYVVDNQYYVQLYPRVLIRNKHPEKEEMK